MKKSITFIAASLAATCFAAAPATLKTDLVSKSGSTVKGSVTFEKTNTGVKLVYDVEGLKKNGTFGFHIHEKGDCSSEDAKSAGKHFGMIAPTGGTSMDNPEKYAGDLPSIKSDANGVAKGSVDVPLLTVDGQYGIQGKALIVHDGPDNPKAKSPARVACGVIQPAPAAKM